MPKVLIALLFIFQQSTSQQSLHYQLKQVLINEHVPAYKLTVAYPRIEGSRDTLVQSRCNKIIDSMITDWAETFKSGALDVADKDSSIEMTSSETISYKVDFATNRLLSIEFGEEGYLSGAAHPGGSSSTLTFDLATGQKIGLVDLFEPNSHFLDTLSSYCISDIRSQEGFNPDYFYDNALSKLSFEQYTIGEESLLIIFPEGQLAPPVFAAGGFTVEIPYSSLRNVLKKNGPIDSLMK